MNELTIVKNDTFGNVPVDVWKNNQDEIFMTADQIGRALEYSYPVQSIQKLFERNEHRLAPNSVVVKLTSTDGKEYDTRLFNAKGIYEIVRFSRQPKADEFYDWVYAVIESIRKNGAYLTPQKLQEVLNDPDTMITLLTKLKMEQQARRQLEDKVEEDKPKVLFAESVAVSKSDILVRDLAKILRQNGIDIGEKRLFAFLRDDGYLIRKKGTDWNMPTQRSMDMGLFRIKPTAIHHSDGTVTVGRTPKVTGKGQIYFVNRFKRRTSSQDNEAKIQ